MWKYLALFLSVFILVTGTIVVFPRGVIGEESKIPVKTSNPERGVSDLSATKNRLNQILDRASENQGINLSPEAKDVLIKDVIREGKDKGIPPEKITISPSEARGLTIAIGNRTKGEEVKASFVNSLIIDEKIMQLKTTIPENIYKYAKISDVQLSMGTEKLIQEDLEKQIKVMAESGLSTVEIKKRNEYYLRAIYSANVSKILDEKGYQKAKYDIFQLLIELTIKSNPPGADVETAGVPIGQTILKKPFESSKEYIFVFKLSGHKTSERKYFVTPYPQKQEITEILIEEEK